MKNTLQTSLHLSIDVRRQDSFDGGEYPEVFLHSEHIKDDVKLRADPHQLLYLCSVCDLGYRRAVDGGRAAAGGADPTQDVHEGGLPRPAVSQQGSDLTLVDVEGQP